IREIHRLIHPNAIFPIKLNRATIPNSIIDAVWGFFAIYIFVYISILLVLLAVGLDFVTAFFAVGACLNNLGPGLGDVATHYGNLSAVAKLLLSLTMILGRLEIFTLLVLFTPMFWRK
ncbi:MAG: potassium transporter TrkG, partial [Pseudomonadales bacterium]|nr:potassium transporter TrkG [Pseudomonadales bacterium]